MLKESTVQSCAHFNCLLSCSHCIQLCTVNSLHSCSLCTQCACYAQSVVNILFVVHCLFVLNNFFVVNSLPVVYEMACWAYIFCLLNTVNHVSIIVICSV